VMTMAFSRGGRGLLQAVANTDAWPGMNQMI